MKKKIRGGYWQLINQYFFKEKELSPDILVNEIIKNSWLVDKSINTNDFNSYIKPILDAADHALLKQNIDMLLENRVDTPERLRRKLIKCYFENSTEEELDYIILNKHSVLKDSYLAKFFLEQVFNSNLIVSKKIKLLKVILQENYSLKSNFKFLEKYISSLIKRSEKSDKEKVINFILDDYISKNDEDEIEWIRMLVNNMDITKGKECIVFSKVKKYMISDKCDRYIFRSLGQGIFKNTINNEVYQKELMSFLNEKIPYIKGVEIKYLFECAKNNLVLSQKIQVALGKLRSNEGYRFYQGNKSNISIDFPVGFTSRSEEIIEDLMSVDLSSRKASRLNASFMDFEKNTSAEKLKSINFIMDNSKNENCSEFIRHIIKRYIVSSKGSEYLICILERAKTDSKVGSIVKDFMRETELRDRTLIEWLVKNDFSLYKTIYSRIK